MMKFNEIYKELSENQENINALKNECKAIENTLDDIREDAKSLHDWKSLKTNEKYIETEKQYIDICEKINQKEIYKKVLQNNAEITFISEFLPLVLAEINVYKNKRIGEKTLEKIRNTVKEKYNIYISIGNSEIRLILPLQDFARMRETSLTIYTKYNSELKTSYKNFNEENKLNELSIEMYNIKSNYIEDIEKYIATKTAQLNAINEAIKVLKGNIEDYTSDLIQGIERPDIYRLNTYGYKMS